MEISPISSSDELRERAQVTEMSQISSSGFGEIEEELPISSSGFGEIEEELPISSSDGGEEKMEIILISSSESGEIESPGKMEISSSEMETTYVSTLGCIAVVYMLVGFCDIQTTGLSNSVSPFVMSLFAYAFSLFTLYSVSRGLLLFSRSFLAFRQLREPTAGHLVYDSAVKFFHLVLFLFSCSLPAFRHFSPLCANISVIPLHLFIYYQSCFRSHWMKLLRRLLYSSSLDHLTTWLEVYFMSAREKTNYFLLPLSTAAATGQESRKNQKIVAPVKFVVGMMGSILFQNYFKMNSFRQSLAFLNFAVAWLANISLLKVSDDFGVFTFILGNVMVGATVAEAGLRSHTWLAFAASLFLYCLSLVLRSTPSIRGKFVFLRVNIVIIILFIIFYYSAYKLLFVHRTYILSDPRPLFDRF